MYFSKIFYQGFWDPNRKKFSEKYLKEEFEILRLKMKEEEKYNENIYSEIKEDNNFSSKEAYLLLSCFHQLPPQDQTKVLKVHTNNHYRQNSPHYQKRKAQIIGPYKHKINEFYDTSYPRDIQQNRVQLDPLW